MKQEKNIEIANRVPPGDKWEVNGKIYNSLTEAVVVDKPEETKDDAGLGMVPDMY